MNGLAARTSKQGRWHRVNDLSLGRGLGPTAACDHRLQLVGPIKPKEDVERPGEPRCGRQGCWPR